MFSLNDLLSNPFTLSGMISALKDQISELRGKIKKAAEMMAMCETVIQKRDGKDRRLRRCIVDPEAKEDDMRTIVTRFEIEWFLFVADCERALPELKPDWYTETANEIHVLPVNEDIDKLKADILKEDFAMGRDSMKSTRRVARHLLSTCMN